MWGADADELDRLVRELTIAADHIDRNSGLLTRTLNNVAWLGDNATRFLGDWSGQQLPRLDLSTRYLRDAATELSRNASQQRAASAASASPGSTSGAGTSTTSSPAQQLEAQLALNEAFMRDYLQTLDPHDPLRVAIEARLAEGYRIYYFDQDKDYIAWATGNLATARNVVVTVPGTGESMQTVTEKMSGIDGHYMNDSGDTAVISTFTWNPPGSIPDNANFAPHARTLTNGPLAGIITSLHGSGRDVVVTGHSAGASAVQSMFLDKPELVSKVSGVALLASSDYHSSFFERMGDKPVVIAYHDWDAIGLVNADDSPGLWSAGRRDNVAILHDDPGGSFGARHSEAGYSADFGDKVTGMFHNEQLDNGMVRQKHVESDGSVGYVDTATY